MSNPGHEWEPLIQDWKFQCVADCFPIKDRSSREEKTPNKGQTVAISSLLCNSVSGKQCNWKLKVKLKAYLSPKAKHKNILIFSEAEPTAPKTDRLSLQINNKEQSTYKGLCEIHQIEQHASSSTAHIWFPAIFQFLQNWRKLFFWIPLQVSVHFFFLIHTVSDSVLP